MILIQCDLIEIIFNAATCILYIILAERLCRDYEERLSLTHHAK